MDALGHGVWMYEATWLCKHGGMRLCVHVGMCVCVHGGLRLCMHGGMCVCMHGTVSHVLAHMPGMVTSI